MSISAIASGLLAISVQCGSMLTAGYSFCVERVRSASWGIYGTASSRRGTEFSLPRSGTCSRRSTPLRAWSPAVRRWRCAYGRSPESPSSSSSARRSGWWTARRCPSSSSRWCSRRPCETWSSRCRATRSRVLVCRSERRGSPRPNTRRSSRRRRCPAGRRGRARGSATGRRRPPRGRTFAGDGNALPSAGWDSSPAFPQHGEHIVSVAVLLSFLTDISRWTWLSQYQNVCILDFIEAKGDGGGEWWQLEP